MKIVFRVDSSKSIGIGHLSRCLKLANFLKKKKIYFVTKKLKGNANFLLNEKYKIFYIESKNEKDDAKKFFQILRKKINFNILNDFVVMDNYALKYQWEKILKKKFIKLVTIDDRIRSSKADYFINPNWYFEKNLKFLDYRIKKLLLGPLYNLIDLKKTKRKREFIVIYFGSNDKYNYTTKSVLNLLKIKEKKIVIILGHNFRYANELNNIIKKNKSIKIINKFQNLGKILSKTRIFIGAGGSTTSERLFYKIPSLICPVVKNQELISKLLHDQKFQIVIKKKDFSNFRKWKIAFMNLKKRNIFFSKKLDTLSISQSLSRVSNLFKSKISQFKLIKFKKEHKSILYNFVNQPDAIKSRFTNEYIEIEEHSKFLSNLNLTSTERIYLGSYNKVISGFIRFTFIKKDLAFIDIYCCSTLRGKNFSKMMLFQGIKDILRTNKNIKFLARVRKENIRSLNFFKKHFTSFDFKNEIYQFKYQNQK